MPGGSELGDLVEGVGEVAFTAIHLIYWLVAAIVVVEVRENVL